MATTPGDPIIIKFHTTASSSGQDANSPAIRIRSKDSTGAFVWKYMTPEPKLSFTSNPVLQGDTLLGYESSVTLSCWALPSGDAPGRARQITQNLGTIQNEFNNADALQIFGTPSETHPIYEWPVLNPTISVDESDFYNFVRFSVQFNAFNPASEAVSGILISDPEGKTGAIPNARIPLASFSDTFTYEPDSSFGVPYDDPTGQVYRFSRTVSAKGRPPSRSSVNDSSVFNKNACSGVKAYVDYRSNIDTFSPYIVTDDFRYIEGLTVFNLSKSFTVDLAELSYSVTTNGLYANGAYAQNIKQSGAFETFSTNVQKEVNSSIVNVSVDGTLTGYSVGAPSDHQNTRTGAAGVGAVHTLSQISNGGDFAYGSVVFRRAQSACSVPLNAIPKSISIGDSSASDGKITYNVQYDNRPANIVPGSISESITVNDTYPTDVYASIQIMGKRSGPVFQYMNTTTHYERDVSIEIVLDTQGVSSITSQSYGRLMNYSPSVNSNTRNIVNNLINDLSPAGNFGYTMLKQCNESWSPKEGRYTVNVGWVYK